MNKKTSRRILLLLLAVCMLFQLPVLDSFMMQAKAQETTSNLTLSYSSNGTWKNFNTSVQSSMDGIKIQTSGNSSYYLQYRTWNQGQ